MSMETPDAFGRRDVRLHVGNEVSGDPDLFPLTPALSR